MKRGYPYLLQISLTIALSTQSPFQMRLKWRSHMISATLLEHMGSDLTTVNAARVSFKKHHKQMESGDPKLISYLADHKHLSPFGHCFASFHVKAPMYVARQLVKHKFLRWNEVSRRYVSDDPEFYTPAQWRGKAKDKKQGSEGVVDGVEVQELRELIAKQYKKLLEMGVCEEQARGELPLSTMTEWVWSGSLDAWADMCRLRCSPDTQLETQFVAQEISDDMRRIFPYCWGALLEPELMSGDL
jgi:thymidylate synthase (FAD)